MVCTEHCSFKQGELLKLAYDDGTSSPSFINPITGKEIYVNMYRLAIYDPENPEHAALRVKLRLINSTKAARKDIQINLG
jgi:hypothetical protein